MKYLKLFDMSYLKVFEDFNIGYEEISEEEYSHSLFIYKYDKSGDIDALIDKSEIAKFTEKDAENIIDLFDCQWEISNELSTDNRIHFIADDSLIINHTIGITKNNDEWYYVFDIKSGSYFKCDQEWGVINCLKMEKLV